MRTRRDDRNAKNDVNEEEKDEESEDSNWLLAQWAWARWGWVPTVALVAWATVGLQTWQHLVALILGFVVSSANYRAGFTMGCCCQLMEEEESRSSEDLQ